MKSRLNITVDEKLVEKAKRYAEDHDTSLSQLVEEYLETLVRKPKKKENIVDFMAKLPKPKKQIELPENLYAAYYESRRKKYGF
jgi:hypothetical protein